MAGLFDLTDRVIVVTGGLGQLGRQFTCALLEHGARVAVLDVAEGSALDGQDLDRIMHVRVDITRRETLVTALHAITTRWGVPDGLVNNAALDSPPNASADDNGPFETFPEASFDRVMDVNVKGTFLCCQVFGGAMAAAGKGAIVNVGSIYGVLSPDQALYEYRRQNGETFYKPVAYSVSKSALYNLTRYLAVYWGKAGVRVNIVTFAGVFNNQDPSFLERYLPKVPLGRMAAEDEYNGTVVYLLSEASRYMTGSNVVIDGGFTAL